MLIAFFILAVQIFVTLIEFKLTTLAGFVLIPFALFNKTAFLAEKVLGNIVGSGVKILVLAVIVGIGSGLFSEFTTGFSGTPTITDALALVLGALSLMGLSIFGPGIATGLVSGAPQLGAGAAVGTGLAAAGIGAAGIMGASAGLSGAATRLNPPGDSEAAITVGGRQADTRGRPAAACPRCLGGPGPDGMLKPDVAWFSELRMIGGAVGAASSYPTALVSSLAAHTFANLREPTPDLVKALLINAGERKEHDAGLGWGTPFHGTLPWSCEPGSVTLAWRAKLQPGANYYWSGIPIPPELIRNGKLYGRASLTAILKPLVSPFAGANYFASRLQTSLRYPTGGDDWEPLVGKMLESTLKEEDAREELKKWQPIRRHTRDFTHRDGIAFDGTHLQLYARVYTRDLYQFGWNHHSQAGEQEVAFVLTLWSADGSTSIYNSTVGALGNFVESAVVNQDIEVSND